MTAPAHGSIDSISAGFLFLIPGIDYRLADVQRTDGNCWLCSSKGSCCLNKKQEKKNGRSSKKEETIIIVDDTVVYMQ